MSVGPVTPEVRSAGWIPASLLLPARPRHIEQPPERLRVGRLAQVIELVNDDVLENFRWRDDETPREGQVAQAPGLLDDF